MSVDIDTCEPPALRKPRSYPGEIGMWVFILIDLSIFCALFVMFVVDRSDNVPLFDEGSASLSISWGAINTIVLLTGSLFVVWAVHAAKQRRLDIASRLVTWAMGTGAIFLLNKVFEWGDKLAAGHTAGETPFYTYYFCLTGLHAVHLIIALCALLHVRHLLAQPDFGPHDEVSVETVATYWHMVDLLWIALFATLYMMI